MIKKSGDYIEKWCLECNGEGRISACCGEYVSPDNRCGICGRFCKTDWCCECNGEGYRRYARDDEIEVFVCIWSPDYLKDLLYKPKKQGDTKTYRGVITKIFPDDNRAEVRLRGKKEKMIIDIDELNTY
jgi:hypothetical protein